MLELRVCDSVIETVSALLTGLGSATVTSLNAANVCPSVTSSVSTVLSVIVIGDGIGATFEVLATAQNVIDASGGPAFSSLLTDCQITKLNVGID